MDKINTYIKCYGVINGKFVIISCNEIDCMGCIIATHCNRYSIKKDKYV